MNIRTLKIPGCKNLGLLINLLFKLLIICFLTSITPNVHAGKHNVATATELESLSLKAGDTVILKSGQWNNQHLVCKGTGAELLPILFLAETPGKVHLRGSSNLKIDGTWLVLDGLYFSGEYDGSKDVIAFSKKSSNCRLTNSAIVNYNPANKKLNCKWVSIYGTYNRVDHCYLAGKTNEGTTLVVWLSEQPNYHLIDHNYFGNRPPLGVNGGETIRVGTSEWSMHDSYTLVEKNYFEQCNGEIEIISNKSCHNTFRYNTFFECSGTLTLRHGNFAEVYGNFFIGKGVKNSGGVRIIGEEHRVYNNYFEGLTGSGASSAISIMNGVQNSPLNRYFQVIKAKVVANTIIDCTSPIEIGTGADTERTLTPENCVVANNLIICKNSIMNKISEPLNLFLEGNIMFGGLVSIPDLGGFTIIDPKMVKADDGLWRPSHDSPVIGAIKGDYPFVDSDMDGQTRGISKDVGADQISSGAIINSPLNRLSDVGTFWVSKPVHILKN